MKKPHYSFAANMKVIAISTDLSIFDRHSTARERMEAYVRLFDEYHIIIYSPKGFRREESNNLFLYPTNSSSFFFRPIDAVRIGSRILREKDIKVASVQDPAESAIAGWLLKKRFGIRLHIQVHSDFFSPFFRMNSWKEFARWLLARFLLPRGDAYRVVSRRIADSLHSTFRIPYSKMSVLPIFIDGNEIEHTPPSFILNDKYPEFDFIILMAARLVREKNIELALGAFKELVKEFSRTGMVIVGDGPESESLKFKVESLKLANNVRFEGWQGDLISYYKGADLYLLTSNFEGYGRSVIEAAWAGLPVVMTDVGVAGEIIRDKETGLVVPPGDQAALAKALSEARHHYDAMRKMAQKAYQKVSTAPPLTKSDYLRMYQASFSI